MDADLENEWLKAINAITSEHPELKPIADLFRSQRAARLHLPPGTYTFASRRAHRLAYRSQRETPPDRALSRAFALRRKLGATGGTGDYIAKPKGMHWRTFERAMARIRRAEDIVDMYEALLLGRLEESFPDKDR